MKVVKLCLLSAICFLISLIRSYASEESLTITTYYPSPYGSYRELRSQRIAIGETYINGGTYCWEGTCTNTINTNADLVVEGNVGIGTVNPGEKLDVNGNIKATAFFYSSDLSLKQNIQPLLSSSALESILQLHGISFRWKDNNRQSLGLIAQEVEKVYPELVATDASTGLKSVQYGNLIAPLIEAVKEQQVQIESLKAKLKKTER